jgi:Tfp pilus assembly protein PilZ
MESELKDRKKMAREERQSKRNPVFQTVQYFLVPSIIEKTYDGVITDISDSGICLLTTSPLKDRQRIIMLDRSRLSERAAIVRWSQKYDDMFYKIGLEFIEDQTFMNIKDKRRYKRLRIKNLNIGGKTAAAHYTKIVDISLGGLLIETDTKWNIGEEYILHVEYGGKLLSVKGYVVWSILRELQRDHQGNTIPIYHAGMKLTTASNEIKQLLNFIEQRLKRGKENEYSFVSPDGADTWGKHR